MNLKERGLTVGDLFIILFFIILIVFIINKIKDSDKKTYLNLNSFEILIAKK